ncbi:MAG: deoxyribonuclease IV [Thermoplasmata archaeon]|nr:deoxyribonuclease IV [Thermoplasmata archaeon]
MWLGAHIGIAAGLAEAPSTGRQIGCDAIQIFSKSPQMWKGTPIPDAAATDFHAAVRTAGLRATAVHHGYLINLASPKKPMLARSRLAFVDELQRAEKLGVDALIFHPGAHLESGVEAGITTLIESLNWAAERTPGFKVRALLENAAGQGTAMCSSFPELARALAGVEDRARFGVALDTCHLFAAGFDLRTPELYGAFMDQLESELGRREVRAFHLNDAKAPLGSHLDRHENIGHGEIGVEAFRNLTNDARWDEVPGYLETPLDEDGYGRYVADLKTLHSLVVPSEAPPSPPARRRKSSPAA